VICDKLGRTCNTTEGFRRTGRLVDALMRRCPDYIQKNARFASDLDV
jgi:hypothetical protein